MNSIDHSWNYKAAEIAWEEGTEEKEPVCAKENTIIIITNIYILL